MTTANQHALERNIATAIRNLRDHDYTLSANPALQYPPDKQELADVAALMRWPEHLPFLVSPDGATVIAFAALAWLRSNRVIH